MDLRLEGISCPVCHAYLFEDDDVVFCPVCGAPHHRDCYEKIGHCALEELHGTENQFDIDKQRKQVDEQSEVVNNEPFVSKGNEDTICCSMCNQRYDKNLNVCPYCNTPNLEKHGKGFSGFDFLGGVPADYDIGEGVTAEEAKRFVISNTPYYIKKFAKISKTNKVSWNWFGFVFPSVWLLSRKMYKSGIFATVILLAAAILYMPLSISIYNMSPVDTVNYADMMQYLYDLMPNISWQILLAAGIGFLINIAVRFIVALFGDFFYKKYTISSIKLIKEKSEDLGYDFRKKGGVSIFAMFIGLMVINYLPTILMSFII